MEILQEGSPHLKRVYCKHCSGTFEANKAEDLKYWKDSGMNWPMYECPMCHHALVDNEELTKEIEIRREMVESDATFDFLKKWKSWWRSWRRGKK